LPSGTKLHIVRSLSGLQEWSGPVSRSKSETQNRPQLKGAVSVYCLGTLVAEEAQRSGHPGFAKSIEAALSTFLTTMPRDLQSQALRLAYEMALGGESPVPPRLRLVYSRS
jgi:hypothetical protein